MTQEEKAKAYDKAIERAKEYNFDGAKQVVKDLVTYIFPELKESEAERVRNFLHHTFTAEYLSEDKLSKWHGEPVANILAWLEKQNEQKPATWSKEDEDYRLDVNAAVDCYFGDIYAKELHDWLKSLKERYTWKPSEEQLNALHDAAVYVEKSMFPYPKGILMKLYKQLKKLREE